MLLKDENLEIETESTFDIYTSNNLIVYNGGCLVANADALKLFYKLKDIINKPTIIALVCNVTEAYKTNVILNIRKLKEKYPYHEIFITGCINDKVKDKFEKLGKIIKKEDMWDLNNYE